MKIFKKSLSIVLALLMAFSVCVFASAEETAPADEVTGFTDAIYLLEVWGYI